MYMNRFSAMWNIWNEKNCIFAIICVVFNTGTIIFVLKMIVQINQSHRTKQTNSVLWLFIFSLFSFVHSCMSIAKLVSLLIVCTSSIYFTQKRIFLLSAQQVDQFFFVFKAIVFTFFFINLSYCPIYLWRIHTFTS